MKASSNVARVSILFLAFCLPALGQPSSSSGPRKWFHNNHPERSNPHYKDSTHKRVNSHRRVSNHNRP
jgi:hypothetical protein